MAKKMLYGGDYNPEQWEESVWEEDMRMFHLAGIDCVTLNVFSWAALQPDEVTYRFERLDKIMDLVRRKHLKVVLATSTAPRLDGKKISGGAAYGIQRHET